MNTQAFKDTSIYKGIIEFKNEEDKTFRLENKGCNLFSVFKLENNSFIHIGLIRTPKRKPIDLYKKIEENLEI